MAKAGITKGGGSAIQKGPRGGTFYINAHGNKEYGTPPAGHPGMTSHKESAADRLGLGKVGSAFRVSVPKGGSKAPQKPAPAPSPAPKAPAPKPVPAPKAPAAAAVKPPPAPPPAPKAPPAPKPAPVPPKPETKVKPPEPPPAPKAPPVPPSGNTPGRPPPGLPPGIDLHGPGNNPKAGTKEAYMLDHLRGGNIEASNLTPTQHREHLAAAMDRMRLDHKFTEKHPVNVAFAPKVVDGAAGVYGQHTDKSGKSMIVVADGRSPDGHDLSKPRDPANSWSYKPPLSANIPSLQATIVHEYGHHVHAMLKDAADTDRAASKIYMESIYTHRAATMNATPGKTNRVVSRYSVADHNEYFAEHWSAYHHQPEWHKEHHPQEHAMIANTRKHFGMEPL